jgi:DNA polymerase II large subunit
MVLNNSTRPMFKHKLTTIKLGNYSNVAEYLKKIQEIQFELASIGGAMDEQNLVEKVFNIFLDSFGGVLQTFNGNLQLSTFVKLLTKLMQEEKCLAF